MTLQTGAPSMQTFQKVLFAPSDEIAIHRAIQAYPNMQFISVQATQLDASTGGPANVAGTNTPMGSGITPSFKTIPPLQGLRPMWPQSAQQQQESVNPARFAYPYSITLPEKFAKILRETSPVEVYRQNGQNTIILEDRNMMSDFLGRLHQHRDRASCKTIMKGLRSSIR